MKLTMTRLAPSANARWARWQVRDENGAHVALIAELHEWDPIRGDFMVRGEYWIRYSGRPAFDSARHYVSPTAALAALQAAHTTEVSR